MSEQYLNVSDDYQDGNNTVYVEENEWEQTNADENVTVNYVDCEDGSLTQSYLTVGETNNETQYFSMLDTTTSNILNDESVSDANAKSDESEDPFASTQTDDAEEGNNATVDVGGQQVLLYSVDGSNELYGIQVAQDEDGNLQRYQFQVRQNETGQLEAVPESIQVLPVETCTETAQEEDTNEVQEPVSEESETTVFVKQEYPHEETFLEEDSNDELQVNEDEETVVYESFADDKTAILQSDDEDHMDSTNNSFPKSDYSETYHVANSENDSMYQEANESPDTLDAVEERTSPVEQYVEENDDNDNDPTIEDDVSEAASAVSAEHLLTQDDDESQQSFDEEHEEHEFFKGYTEYESDGEDYHMVDGKHITGEDEGIEDCHVQAINEVNSEKFVALQPHVLKIHQPLRFLEHGSMKNFKFKTTPGNVSEVKTSKSYFLLKRPEKENVATIQQLETKVKVNPRSLLKSSHILDERKEEKHDRRIFKSKEAIQAKMFHNFIAKTTILQAPIRQERLPRKQTIKPVERIDEEIIVQEVVVSSRGYIETPNEAKVKKLRAKPVDLVEVSDSDDDYNPKKEHRRKPKGRGRSKIIEISDSDEEIDDEIDLSMDSDDQNIKLKDVKKNRGRPRKNENNGTNVSILSTETNENNLPVIKKKRGRPPKVSKSSSNEEDNSKDDINTLKRKRDVATNMDVIKTENKCPKCPKTFPSEGSLKTHMHCHSFLESNTRQCKYKCLKCSDKFNSTELLTKHMESHKISFKCGLCPKKFMKKNELLMHKRVHMKDHMQRSSLLSPLNDVKVKSVMKSPKKKNDFSCNCCSKTFSSEMLLKAHCKTHFNCTTCSATFISKLLLDNHIRRNCVKSRVPLHSTVTVSARQNLNESLKCKVCGLKVNNYQLLLNHVAACSMIVETKELRTSPRRNVRRGGVPATPRLLAAYNNLRSKVAN